MSYFSNLLTATKTRYNNFRGDECDGDTEDDSHISRVLRNYYTEQGRGFPDWLGGGPRSQSSSNPSKNSHGRSTTGSQRGNPPPSLSDIFDSPAPQTQQGGRPNFTRTQQQRPNLFPGDRSDSTSGSNLTAQQRIKERLWGGRTASPPPNQQQQMPAEQPVYEGFNYNGNGGSRARSPVNGGGSGVYQSYRPQGQMPPPQSFQPGGGRNYGGGMPWDDGSQGGSRKPNGGQPGRVGLPAGPKMMRQGGY